MMAARCGTDARRPYGSGSAPSEPADPDGLARMCALADLDSVRL